MTTVFLLEQLDVLETSCGWNFCKAETVRTQCGILARADAMKTYLHCLTKHHVIKTYWRSGRIAPWILNLSIRWR